nr:MAG TPA: Regulated-SNARE-like domain [Caudoviricetes sp.]
MSSETLNTKLSFFYAHRLLFYLLSDIKRIFIRNYGYLSRHNE